MIQLSGFYCSPRQVGHILIAYPQFGSRVHRIFPVILILGSSTDSGVCSLGMWKLSWT